MTTSARNLAATANASMPTFWKPSRCSLRTSRSPGGIFDHPLSGEWSDHRDCHIRPDLILIYRKPDETSLELVRLGSHGELGL